MWFKYLNLPTNWLSPYIDDIHPQGESFWEEVSQAIHSEEQIDKFNKKCEELEKKHKKKHTKQKKRMVIDKPTQELT
jgi:hypothetical protein